MYPTYPKTKLGRALEVLNHPDGEEFPGQFDVFKKIVQDAVEQSGKDKLTFEELLKLAEM